MSTACNLSAGPAELSHGMLFERKQRDFGGLENGAFANQSIRGKDEAVLCSLGSYPHLK